MDRKKLGRLRREIAKLRGSPRKSGELERLATKLGRGRVKRGAYTWESTVFDLPPVSIPHHSKELKRFTAEGILDHLEAHDLRAWEQQIERQEKRNAEERRRVSESPVRPDAISE